MKNIFLIPVIAVTASFSVLAEIEHMDNVHTVESTWLSDVPGSSISQVSKATSSKNSEIDVVFDDIDDEVWSLKITSPSSTMFVGENNSVLTIEEDGLGKSISEYVVIKDDSGAVQFIAASTDNISDFGIWNTGRGTQSGQIAAFSNVLDPDDEFFGKGLLKANNIPVTGSAVFKGATLANYVDNKGVLQIAVSDLAMQADFAQRSIDFNSTNTTLYSIDLSGDGLKQDNLNLSGNMAWDAGSNSFTGTLSSDDARLSGTGNGHFYGNTYTGTVSEVGGTFAVSAQTGPETLVGAFGATK